MIDSDRRPVSNWGPILKSVSTRHYLKSASFPNSQIYGRFIVIKSISFSF